MLEAAGRLRRERDIQFMCVRASTIERQQLASILADRVREIPIVQTDRYDAVSAADLVWTASGTATVETALLLKPMIIVYRLSWLTYYLARLLVHVDHIGMANLMACERVVPELIQSEFKADRIVRESRIILDDSQVRSTIVAKWAQLRERLGRTGAAHRVADLAFAMMS
jgi:lipid-A-disaccharide synthase